MLLAHSHLDPLCAVYHLLYFWHYISPWFPCSHMCFIWSSLSVTFLRVLCDYPHGQASCRSTRASLWVPEELPIKRPWCEFIGSKFSHLLVAWKYLYFTCISRRYFCWEWKFGSAGGLGVTLLPQRFEDTAPSLPMRVEWVLSPSKECVLSCPVCVLS